MARKMKDSGIEWIGEIPEGWEVCRLKNIVTCHDELRKPISADKRENHLKLYDYYGASGIIDTIDDYNVDGTVLLIGEDGANLKLRNLPLIYRASGKFWVNNHAHILIVNKNHSYDYIAYLLEAGDYSNYITGSAQPKLSQFNLMRFPLAIPNYAEQESISLFIHRKCSKIDSILSKTRSSIEEYKKLKQAVITQAVTKGVRGDRQMKDSGIEWIGEIPVTHSIYKLKYLLRTPLKYGANESGVPYSDNLPRYIRITDITPDGNLKDTGKLSLSKESAKDYILEDGDILFARSGATVGKSFIYHQSYGRSAYAGYLIKASLNDNVFPKFVYYYTCSSLYETWKNSIFIQSTIQNIGADRYANLPIPVPNTLQEQKEIADYLDAKCAEIDKLIAKKEQLVKELEAYKKSLIYEVVTGKREV